jgi:diacylglycerol kinase family enzyme
MVQHQIVFNIIDMHYFQTDYEGQIKTLMQYLDPNIDGIIVAGGDGTLLEVSHTKIM